MTTSTRLLALYDGARALGLSAPSARSYTATMAARMALTSGRIAAVSALAEALADRTAGRTGSTLVKTAANAAPEVL